MPTKFSRYNAPFNRSFALRAFNAAETEINQHFWSFKAISEYSRYVAQQAKDDDPTCPAAAVFHATGPDARRIPPTVSEWLDARKELENWLRLSALASASSYLETYIRRIVRTALMSDPMCRFSASHLVDGIALLKSGKELPFDDELEGITKGDWSKRISSFKSVFGDVPDFICQNISSLEEIRSIRNNFAHGFGRALDILSPSSIETPASDRVAQNRFVAHIALISKVAASIDRQMLKNHVGSFELIFYYHDWRKNNGHEVDRGVPEDRALKQHLNANAGCAVSVAYCTEMIAYYQSR